MLADPYMVLCTVQPAVNYSGMALSGDKFMLEAQGPGGSLHAVHGSTITPGLQSKSQPWVFEPLISWASGLSVSCGLSAWPQWCYSGCSWVCCADVPRAPHAASCITLAATAFGRGCSSAFNDCPPERHHGMALHMPC